MTQKPLSQSGVFSFRAPAKPVFQVGRNLLLLFCVPEVGLCTGVLSEATSSPAELKEMLDNAFRHLLDVLGSNLKPVEVKLFGASHGDAIQLQIALLWVSQHGLRISAKDVGRQFIRQVFVDTATARVGVNYGRAAMAGTPELLSLGSARTRIPSQGASLRALVLSASPVQRRLALQALEEYPHCEAEAPADPLEWMLSKSRELSKFSLVLLCEGAAALLEMEALVDKNDRVPFCWIGHELPKELTHPRSVLFLGPLEPEFLGEFKGALAELLRSLQGSAAPTGEGQNGHRRSAR